jgi:hypothetical protein
MFIISHKETLKAKELKNEILSYTISILLVLLSFKLLYFNYGFQFFRENFIINSLLIFVYPFIIFQIVYRLKSFFVKTFFEVEERN